MSKLIEGGLEPIQMEFLELLASSPQDIEEHLKSCRVSPRRLATWLSKDEFRGAYMARCSHYEEMMWPAFMSGVRKRALSEAKDAWRFANLYVDVMRERSEALQARFNDAPAPAEEPTEELPAEGTVIPEQYSNLSEEDVADLNP